MAVIVTLRSRSTRSRRRLARAAAGLAVLTTLPALAPGWASADTSPVPGIPPTCLPEQYPHAGAARGTPSVPYEIPFTATLGPVPQPAKPLPTPTPAPAAGGYLEIAHSPLVTVILGGPISAPDTPGSIYASACGLLQLPSQTGGIAGHPYGDIGGNTRYNNNFVFDNPIPVSIGIKGIPGIPLMHAYGAAEGQLDASISPTPAANGGLNVTFLASAKATSDLGPALATLIGLEGGSIPGVTVPSSISSLLNNLSATSGNTCTIPIGNLLDAGVPAGDLTKVTGLSDYNAAYKEATTPAVLSSTAPGGQPITGPLVSPNADGSGGMQTVLVGNDFPVEAIDPNTPPAPDAIRASTTPPSCSNAALLNQLLDLPSPAGDNTFYAPGTFAIHTSA